MKDRLRRSRLYMPGNNPYLSQNAFLFGADCIILDLEDSVPPKEKFASRILVRNILKNVNFGASEKAVRINPFLTPFGVDDLKEIVQAEPDLIVIPKVESIVDIMNVEEIVQDQKKLHGVTKEIFYMCIIETALGVLNSYEIASSFPSVTALVFGAEDFTRDIGTSRSRTGKETFTARSMIVMAAKAAGIQASDTVWSDINDIEGLRKSTEEGKSLGFDGRGAIHPSQIAVIHDVYSPSKEELEYARKVINAFGEAERTGSGVISLCKKMIDAPIVARARRTLEIAKKTRLLNNE